MTITKSLAGGVLFLACIFVGCSEQPTNSFVSLEAPNSILGGEDVDSQDPVARHAAMLVDLETNQICSATLIRPQVLLTAAHCVSSKADMLSVYFDVDPVNANSTVLLDVDRVITHPEYSQDSLETSVDLALIVLKESAPESSVPAELPSVEDLGELQKLEVVGYGVSSTSGEGFGRLRKVQVPVAELQEGFIKVDQSQGQGICDGDSGGAAFLLRENKRILVGVTKMASCLESSQFTRVDTNLSWILQPL